MQNFPWRYALDGLAVSQDSDQGVEAVNDLFKRPACNSVEGCEGGMKDQIVHLAWVDLDNKGLVLRLVEDWGSLLALIL